VRTPWKFLYDFTNPVIEADVPFYAYELQGTLWVGLWAGVIAIFLWLVHWVVLVIFPVSNLAQFLDLHFLGTWIVLCGAFFFYWFFRMVWDGLLEPTVKPINTDQSDG
jgi:hypothetical protein